MGNYILLALTVFFFVCHLQSIVSQQTSIVQKLKQMENNIGSLKTSTKKEIKKLKTEFNKLSQETNKTIQAGIEECRNTTADLRGWTRDSLKNMSKDVADGITTINSNFADLNRQFNQLQQDTNGKMTEIETNRNNINDLKDELANINRDFIVMKREFNQIKQETRGKTTAIETIRNTVEDLKGQVMNQPSYAFYAYGLSGSSIFVGRVFVFQHSQVNENNVYGRWSGKFTAPVSGIYAFSATLCTSPNTFVVADFIADYTKIGKVISGDVDFHLCSSASAIAKIQKGTQVFLKVQSGSPGNVIVEDHARQNSFSGFLIST